MRIYEALGIQKHEIEKRQAWQSYIESNFNAQRRLADWHFERTDLGRRDYLLYGEQNPAGERVLVNMFQDVLTLEYEEQPLSRYTVERQPDEKHLRRLLLLFQNSICGSISRGAKILAWKSATSLPLGSLHIWKATKRQQSV
jgi:hypothetical protein